MFTLGECGMRLASLQSHTHAHPIASRITHPLHLTPSHSNPTPLTPTHPPTPSLTFHHLLQALPHDVDVVNVVELIHNVGIMVQVLVPLTSGPVRYGIDLRELFGGKKNTVVTNIPLIVRCSNDLFSTKYTDLTFSSASLKHHPN